MARRRKFDPEEQLNPDQLEELEEEGAFDSRGILKDGHSTSVKLYMRDGAINPHLTPTQRGKAMQQTQDAAARRFGLSDGLQLHRPGFRRVTDAVALERTRQAYNDYDTTDAQAYKRDYNEHTGSDPSRTGAGAPNRGSGAPPGAYPYSAAAEGASCSVDGRPGTLVRQGNWLVCRPRGRQDATSFDAKAVAYAEYDREMSVAYLRGK